MDPAETAAHALSATFAKLEVPCEVRVSAQDGKYVVATTDLPEDYTLVEEVPIVSWPTRTFLALHLPFCFHCLRRDKGAAEDADARTGWTTCGACHSGFCSDLCRSASHRSHELLCEDLASLREDAHPITTGDVGVCGGEAGGALTMVDTKAGTQDPPSYSDEEGSITPESLARCAAWVLARVAAAVERQHLTEELLSDGECGRAMVRELFAQAVAPFERLLDAPDNAAFTEIADPREWFARVRAALTLRGLVLLARAAGGCGAEPAAWARDVVEATLSDATLRTFLGQLVLNAHAINDYVLLDRDLVLRGEDAGGVGAVAVAAATHGGLSSQTVEVVPPVSTSADLTNALQGHHGIRFAWMMKGAGVYSLLSTFNHSCEPNVAITYVDGTHEITIKTTQPVRGGDQLHNTYIPLKDGSTPEERRSQLRGYFFVCQCSRCVRESAPEKA